MARLLETELKTYERHRAELLGTAEGKCVLIRDDRIVGVFESRMDAIGQGYERFGNVPFLVKEILQVEEPVSFVSNILGV